MSMESKTDKEEIYKMIQNISNILSQDITMDIISHLSDEPKRYKDLKKLLNTSDATLSRRLDKLLEYNIIQSLPVSFGKKQYNEYVITEFGNELIRFFERYKKEKT